MEHKWNNLPLSGKKPGEKDVGIGNFEVQLTILLNQTQIHMLKAKTYVH